ncbi:Isoprimeverose transporter [subsurface metagenome]
MNEKNIKEKKVKDKVHSLRGHLLYSLGAIPSSLPYQIIGSYIVLFYEVIIGLDPFIFGVLWVIYGVWNAINDPLAGYLMDKKVTKWGRRVPYIVVGTIPFTIGFILLWWVPWTDQMAIFFHALLMLFLFDLGFTLAMTAWSALYTEMYEEEEERATMVAMKDTFAFLSGMVSVIITPMIVSATSWTMAGIIFGLTIPISMYLSLLGIKERKEYQIDKPLSYIPAFKETLTNKPFLIITLTYAILDTIFGLTMMVLPLYAFFVLEVEVGLIGVGLLGIALGILISVLFWRWMYAKKGPKYGLLLSMGIFTATIWPIFLVNDFTMLILITIIPGFGVGGMLMTEPAVSAAIDYDELKTGKRREGTYTGVFGFIVRLSLVLAAITLTTVQLLTGFESGAETQSPSALFGLTLLISLVPVLGGLCALITFKFFPINYKNFCEQQEKLKVLHEKRLIELEKIQ